MILSIQEPDGKILGLVSRKQFYPYEYMSDFEKFKQELISKKTFYSSLTGKKLLIKSNNMFLRFGINLK